LFVDVSLVINTPITKCMLYQNSRGVCRNFEEGFPPKLSDCYIRVIHIA